MQGIQCGYSACFFNSSTKRAVPGRCEYLGTINLAYRIEEFTDEEGDFVEVEGLDCEQYVDNISKFDKHPDEL